MSRENGHISALAYELANQIENEIKVRSRHTIQEKLALEALIFEFRQKINKGSWETPEALLKDYDEHFSIIVQRGGENAK